MSESTLQDLKELIVNLDKNIDMGFAELKGEIKRLEGKIEQVETKLIGQIEQVETKLTGEIKRFEDTLSVKFDGLDKRLSNQETISRTAFGALMVARRV